MKLAWKTLGNMVDLAFQEIDKSVFIWVICVAQWILLMQRFGVKSADLVVDRI
jgi:hypothetical protein